MLIYAYLRKLPCQIVIAKNKELPFSEKKWRVQFGCSIIAGYSDVIDPKEYATFEDFLQVVQKEWDAKWAAVFSHKNPKGHSFAVS